MAGAAAWMAAPAEPPAGAGWLVFVVFGAAALALARAGVNAGAWRAAAAALCGAAALMGLGAGAGEVRAWMAESPRLSVALDDVTVTGFVIEAEQGAQRPRMLVQVSAIEPFDGPLPHRVMLSTLPDAAYAPGQSVRCRAALSPPAGPMAPHSYDAARAAYFQQIGARGFTLGRCRPGGLAPPDDLLRRLEVQLSAWRRALTEAIYASSPDDGGAIAAALVTGDRSLMSEAAVLAFRDSGLAHMLSVSGLHMSLVGGGVFLVLWTGLALVPRLALFAPVKKWAAVGALLALSAYLVVSGANVPAVRAYIMAAVAFGAVLIDRPALSMRGLVVALALVALMSPDAVVEPGFQMSFAATGALVAWFEARQPRPVVLGDVGFVVGVIQNGAGALGGVLLISLVAGLATDPFGLFHFQRITLYGLPVNLAVSPITTFVVAPAALAAAALAPFGLAEWPLRVMADALIVIVQIAKLFADRPEAVQAVAAIPALAFGAVIVGMMWMMVWRGALRWLGVLGLAIGAWAWAATPIPIAAFDGDGRAIVARAIGESAGGDNPAGGAVQPVAIARGRASEYVTQRMAGLLGIGPEAALLLPRPRACLEDGAACQWRAEGGLVFAYAPHTTLLEGACDGAALVFLDEAKPTALPAPCANAQILDLADLAALGGGLVRVYTDGAAGISGSTPSRPELRPVLRLERAREWSGHRRWTGPLSQPRN